MAATYFDFEPRRVAYAGSVPGRWFVSCVEDGSVLMLDPAGLILERFPAHAFKDRIIDVGGTLIALGWEHAWGRNAGAKREHATGYDLMSGRPLWHFDRGLWGLAGELGVASDQVFELRTGAQRFGLDAHGCAVASDATQLYLLRPNGAIAAHALATGHAVWTLERRDARAFAVYQGFVWVVTPSHLVRVDARTGRIVEERDFAGVHRLFATQDALVLQQDQALSILQTPGGRAERLVHAVDLAVVASDGRGIAFCSMENNLVGWMDHLFGEEQRMRMNGPFTTLYADHGMVTVARASTLLRFSFDTEAFGRATQTRPAWDPGDGLEPATVVFAGPNLVLVNHATRGRFTLHVANTGLAKGATVSIGGFVPGPTHTTFATKLAYRAGGQVVSVDVGNAALSSTIYLASAQPSRKKKVTKRAGGPVRRLIDTLVADGLMDAPTDSAERKLARRLFPDGNVGPDAKALLLQYVHGLNGGLARGFIAHDRRFRRETDDVIAEFGRCLVGEPVSFAQIGQRDDALYVRATFRGRHEDSWVNADSLTPVVTFLNDKLAAAGARKRVHALETGDGWQAFVVR